jgi:hypothetical protein
VEASEVVARSSNYNEITHKCGENAAFVFFGPFSTVPAPISRSIEAPPDPGNRTAARAGGTDGGCDNEAKGLGGSFDEENNARVADWQAGKIAAFALDALPYFVLAYSGLVLLWAALGLILGGRA